MRLSSSRRERGLPRETSRRSCDHRERAREREPEERGGSVQATNELCCVGRLYPEPALMSWWIRASSTSSASCISSAPVRRSLTLCLPVNNNPNSTQQPGLRRSPPLALAVATPRPKSSSSRGRRVAGRVAASLGWRDAGSRPCPVISSNLTWARSLAGSS
jgi:hypothetical protein